MPIKKLKYDTPQKRLAAVRKKGNIITFKEPYSWMGESFKQIIVYGMEKERGAVKIISGNRDSKWYKSIDKEEIREKNR